MSPGKRTLCFKFQGLSQTDAFGAPAPPEELIKLFWELEGLNALSASDSGYTSNGVVDRQWLDQTFDKAGKVIAESVKAGVECGSFGLQLMPNAFEVSSGNYLTCVCAETKIFGVDLLLSFPPGTGGETDRLPIPRVTLLEYNASPDFHQSGIRLRGNLAEMFKGVVEISIKPFFNLQSSDQAEGDGKGMGGIGSERYGWRLVGKGEIRGPTV